MSGPMLDINGDPVDDDACTCPHTITILTADNGHIVTDNDGACEVVEADEMAEHGNVWAASHLLWRVLERIGMVGSKHDEARVRVRVENPDGKELLR